MNRAIRLAAVSVLIAGVSGADWRQFRGNEANGVSPEAGPATLEKIAWKADLPGRGLSAPIVVGSRVFVTASSGYEQDRLHVICFDARNGSRLWERQFWATGRTQTHPKTCVAAPSPASDGERVFAFFSSNDLVCLDLDGNLLWYRGLGHENPNANNSLGMASSPVVVEGTLVAQVESDAEAFAAGLDVKTGQTRWKIDRPQRANWTSPAILRGAPGAGDDLALLQSSAGLSAVEPRTGKEIWSYTDGASTTSSTAINGKVVYVPSHGLTALRPVPGQSGPEQLWRTNRLRPSFSSPVVSNGFAYAVNSAGVLTGANAATGEDVWRLRLKGPFSGSPVAAEGRLYLFSEDGLGTIVELDEGRRGRIVSECDLGETILSTPALAEGALYVRSDNHLWKFAR